MTPASTIYTSMKKAGPLLLLVFITLLAMGCSLQQPNEAVILFVSLDQQETQSLNPSRLTVAAALALESFQREHPDVPIRHHHIYYSGDAEEGARLADEYLTQHPNTFALVGDINSQGTALLAEVALRHQVLHLSFFATDESIFEDKPFSFSYRGSIHHETQKLAAFFDGPLPASRVFVLVSQTSNIAARWEAIAPELEARNIHALQVWNLEADHRDYRSIIRASNAYRSHDQEIIPWVLMMNASHLEDFLQQARLEDMQDPLLLTPIALIPEAIAIMPDFPAPIYSAVQANNIALHQEDVQLLTFAEDYRLAMGNHRMDSLGLWIYDGVQLLHEQRLAGRNAVQASDALREMGSQRLVGHVRFNEAGLLVDSPFVPVIVEKGQLVEVSQ